MPTVMGIYELPAQAAGVVTKLRSRGFADIETYAPAPFPEVDDAINCSKRLSYGITRSTFNELKKRARAINGNLIKLDKKYKVSKTVGKLVKIDPRKDFPEIYALSSIKCKPGKVTAKYKRRLEAFLKELGGFDRKYKVSETAGKLFDFSSIQRNLNAAGRFVYIDRVKGNPNFLTSIPQTLKIVRANADKYPELHHLRTHLMPYIPEWQ